MSGMIEKAATAMVLTASASGATGDDLIRDMATQAIMAMREPTREMLEAARDWSYGVYGKPIGDVAARGCWQAMLAAAARTT